MDILNCGPPTRTQAEVSQQTAGPESFQIVRHICAENARDPGANLFPALFRTTDDTEAFALIVDGAVDFALFLLDAQGRISTWNSGAERLLSYTAEEVLGRHIRLFFTPEDAVQGVPDQLLRRASSDGRADNERWHVRKDGARFWASGIDRALKDEAGQVRGFTIVFRDATEQKLMEDVLRRSEDRLRLMVECATDYAIFALDIQGKVTEWSAGAGRILGYTEEEALGQFAEFIFTPEDRERGTPQFEMEQALADGRAEDERWHLKKDGSRFWGCGVLSPLLDEDNKPRGFVKVFRDLTLRHRMEQERLLAERHASVLEERNRMARELHDTLSQGFTAIKLHLDVAEDAMDDDPREARRMLVRARDIVQQSHAEARGSIRALRVQVLASGDLRSALEHLVDQAMTGPELDVRLLVEGTPQKLPVDVETDLYRIAQEALTNALRYAHARHVLMTLSCTERLLILKICDDGQGFDPNADGEHGLGLRGMHERAERLQAKLTVSSTPHRGTDMTLVLSVSCDSPE